MTTRTRLATVAAGVVVLLLGVAIGVRMSRPHTESPPVAPVATAPAVEEAPVTRDHEPEGALELCGPLTDPGTEGTETFGAIRVTVSREDDQCRLDLRTTGGERVEGWDEDARRAASDSWASISAHSVDLDGDDVAELLLSGDSGGSGGYHDSWIVSQTPHPRAIEFPHACGVRVVEAPGGGRALHSCVLRLEVAGLDCNACQPRPPMFYRYKAGALTQVNAEFVKEYDAWIAELEKEITPDQLKEFLASKDADDPAYGTITRQLIVRMAVYYVYSDRPDEARRTLEQMWPVWDRASIVDEVIGHASPGSP